MLTIENLHVSVGGVPVLRGIDLHIAPGETFILFGPNGSGKTTLLMTLMGFSGYEVTEGKIVFQGKDITHAPMYERARLGIGMSFQRPPTIHGLSTGALVKLCDRKGTTDVSCLARRVHFDQFLDRDVNSGFSGGEIKRSELLQLMAQQPGLALFDEPESGVDLENMTLVGNTVRYLLDGMPDERCGCPRPSVPPALLDSDGMNGGGCGCPRCPKTGEEVTYKQARRTSGLIITHTGHILEHVRADRGQVMYKGKLCCEDNPRRILDHIARHGYRECLRCLAGGIHEHTEASRA